MKKLYWFHEKFPFPLVGFCKHITPFYDTLIALPSIKQEHWLPTLQAADALLVGGGENLYLCYWLWQSGLVEILPTLLQNKVYVGASAGSMLVTASLGEQYDGINPPRGSDKTLQLVDFALRPHLETVSSLMLWFDTWTFHGPTWSKVEHSSQQRVTAARKAGIV